MHTEYVVHVVTHYPGGFLVTATTGFYLLVQVFVDRFDTVRESVLSLMGRDFFHKFIVSAEHSEPCT